MSQRRPFEPKSDPFAGDEAFSQELKAMFDNQSVPWGHSPLADSQIAEAASTARELNKLSQLETKPLPAEPERRRRYAMVLAAALTMFAVMGGVGALANGAAPGDALFAVDLALEEVGIGDGQTDERMQEVAELAANGDIAASLDHAAVTVATIPDAQVGADAEGALVAASQSVRDGMSVSSSFSQLIAQLADSARAGEAEEIARVAFQIRDSMGAGS